MSGLTKGILFLGYYKGIIDKSKMEEEIMLVNLQNRIKLNDRVGDLLRNCSESKEKFATVSSSEKIEIYH